MDLLELTADYFKDANLSEGSGCNDCKKGFRGRMGLYEIFTTEASIVKLIFDSAPTDQIRDRARELGMRTLREDGLRKAVAGITTLEEVFRVTMGDAD